VITNRGNPCLISDIAAGPKGPGYPPASQGTGNLLASGFVKKLTIPNWGFFPLTLLVFCEIKKMVFEAYTFSSGRFKSKLVSV
jgi:hypothetical protein